MRQWTLEDFRALRILLAQGQKQLARLDISDPDTHEERIMCLTHCTTLALEHRDPPCIAINNVIQSRKTK